MEVGMWIRKYSKKFKNISLKSVWDELTDINNWPTWHGDLDSCHLVGEFQAGSYFLLKPKGMRQVKIELTEIHPPHSFTDCTIFFGAKMYDTHSLEQEGQDLVVKNKIEVKGWLYWLWVFLVARYVVKTIPDETEALIALVRRKHGL
jgi:hypothetical protein